MNPNNSFDSRVKDKLGEISTSPSYGSWDSFHKKWTDSMLQEDTPDDLNFDKAIRDKIAKIQRFHTKSHWEKLKYRLETIEIYKRKIWINKTKELIAVLLFLFTFYNVNEHLSISSPNNFQNYATLDVSVDLLQQQYACLGNHIFLKNNDVLFVSGQNDVLIKGTNLNESGNLLKHVIYGDHITLSENIVTSETGITGDVLQDTNHHIFTDNTTIPATDQFSETALLKTSSVEPYSLYPLLLPMNPILNKRKNKVTRVGIFTAFANNFILSPFDKVYSLPEFSKAAPNWEFGATVSRKINNVEFETGIAYAPLSYTPAKVSETFGANGQLYFVTSLKQIRYDFIRIPVNFNYFAIDNNKWKLYLSAGSSMNLIASADYNVEEKVKRGEIIPTPRNPNVTPRLEDKPFSEGIFNDSSLKRNYYIDMQLGMGVERKINELCNVFVYSSYHAFLFSDGLGVGPNQDKINALSLQTGFKFNLTERNF